MTTSASANRVFLLSPARCDGRRARMVLNANATFDLATRLAHGGPGAPIGEVFAFLSGLYFRGKLTYARAFGARAKGAASVFVITTNRGLVTPDTLVTRDDLSAFATVDIAFAGDRFRAPLRESAERLDADLGSASEVVLWGSIATGNYADTLIDVCGDRLVFPIEFVGRGDMSRGGLLLRCARDGVELAYAPVRGAIRHGKRPPKLGP